MNVLVQLPQPSSPQEEVARFLCQRDSCTSGTGEGMFLGRYYPLTED